MSGSGRDSAAARNDATAAQASASSGRDNSGLDRACAYADGLFETIAFFQGQAPFWHWHMQRLQRDAARLALQPPAPAELLPQAQSLAAGEDCVLRLTLSRANGRGYWPLLDVAAADRSLSSSRLHWQRRAMPPTNNAGYSIDWADMHLGSQPLLGGIKHLGRLEQVMAAAEAQQRGLDELLLCDADGYLVEAISSNVLVYQDGQWLTPAISSCGVSGVLRAWLLAQGLISPARLHREDLSRPTALVLCNSVRGIQGVGVLAGQAMPDHAAVGALGDAVTRFIQAAT